MPKILFIAPHRFNRSPSQRYRFEQYWNFLESQGYECSLSYVITEKADGYFYARGNILKKLGVLKNNIAVRLRDLKNISNYDMVFIQREAFLLGSTYFEKKISQSGVKMVYDFDDSIWLLDVSHGNKIWKWLKNPGKTAKLISCAHLVFAGNKYLANYAKQFNINTHIIPTTVDTDVFKRKQPYVDLDTVCIGWSGSITTIKHFEQIVPVLKRIKNKYTDAVYFKVMGDAAYVNKDLDIKGIGWSSRTEVEVISGFDIGIMPLPDNEWAKGKCGLKGLTYMALEVPTIMSAVGVNKEIIQDGVNGFLAYKDDEWYNKLCMLIESFTLRQKLGKAGRNTVVEKYSVQAQKYNYLNRFNELLKLSICE